MRRNNVLFQQHIGEMFWRHWNVQGKRIIRDAGANKALKERGIAVVDAREVVNEKPKVKEVWPIVGYKVSKPKLDSTHPDYHEMPCLMYEDHNVLLEGLEQAKVLTNTVEVEKDALPPSLQTVFDHKPVQMLDKLVQRTIKASLLYDAYQEKLPKRHDPERPAWNFPRDYGITDKRRNLLLSNRLIQLCAAFNPDLSPKRRILNDVTFKVPLIRCEQQLMFTMRSDLLITCGNRIRPALEPEKTIGARLPSLSPLFPTISLESRRIYKLEDIFPMTEDSILNNLHTALVHYNETEVHNVFETEVTETQILGRSLMKSFTFALAQARHTYGNAVEDLSEPLVVQCIQTDGKMFHFSVLQLNTTKEDGDVHNVYWSLPRLSLYDVCTYVEGRPVLEGYNPQVFKWLQAFYNNS